MDKVLVNIRGSKGSGKSAIPLGLMNDPEKYVVVVPYKDRRKQILTVLPSYGWVVLGTYWNKKKGLDVFENRKMIEKALLYALVFYSKFDILIEGDSFTNLVAFSKRLLKEIKERFPERKVIVMNFVTPTNLCIEQLKEQGKNNFIDETNLEKVRKSVLRNASDFKQAGCISLKIDPSNVLKDDIVKHFLNTIDTYKIGE